MSPPDALPPSSAPEAPATPLVQEAIRKLSPRLELHIAPESPVLGKDREVVLTFLVTDLHGAPAPNAELKVSTLVGSLGPVTPEGGGRFVVSFYPPDFQAPTVAILAVQSSYPGSELVGDELFVPLPLIGVNRLPVQSLPELPVRFEVAGKVFGPFEADAKGIAQAVIEVPPGVMQARVVSARPGTHLEEQVELKPPPFARIRFMPVVPLKADGTSTASLRVGVISPAGVLSPAGKLQLRAQSGTVTPPLQEQDGTWKATYTAPRSSTLLADRVTAILSEGGFEQTQVLEVDLIPSQSAGPAEGGLRQATHEKVPPPPVVAQVLPPGKGAAARPEGASQPAAPGSPGAASSSPGRAPSEPGRPPVPGAAGQAPPPNKPVSTGRTVNQVVVPPSARAGLKVMTFLGGGVYTFQQHPVDPMGLLPDEDILIQAATLAAPGIGLEGWFNGFVGFSARYQGAFYTFSHPGVDQGQTQGDVKHVLSVDARGRLPLELGGVPVSVGAALGVSVQDHPAFEQTTSAQGENSIRFQYDLLLPVLQPGLELWVYPSEMLALWAEGGVGVHLPGLGQTTTSLEVGGLYQVKPRLGIGLGVQLWQRHLSASSQGIVLGTLEDVWIQGLGYLAWNL